MSDTQAAPNAVVPPAASLPPMPEDAQMIMEGKMRFVPDRRTLEKAPALLWQAGWILAVGCLLPWVGHGGGLMTTVAAKVLACLSALFLFAAVKARTKDPVPLGLGALAKPRWGKPYAWKPKGLPETVAHAIPSPLHVLGLLCLVGAVALPFFDPQIAERVAASIKPASSSAGAAEVGLLLVGLLTVVHVYSYERGGEFNPLYAFMFLGPLLMGAPRITNSATDPKIIGSVGALIAVGAGAYAVYIIVVAMMGAKKQGDAKKAAAMEARRAARKGA